MPSGIHYHHLGFRNVEAEQFKEVLDGANLEHTIISGQRGRAEIEQFHGAAFSLDRGHYAFPVVARGQFAAGCICIGIATGEHVATWINGSFTGRGDLQLYYEGADIFYRAGPEANWAGLTVTRERLQAAALKRLGRELPLSSPGAMEHLHVEPGAFNRLTRLIRSLRPNLNRIPVLRNGEATSELLLGTYVEAIATAEPSTAGIISQRAAHRHEIVRKADATMRNLIGTHYSSSHFCKGIGMSERNLELYFHEALGMSPKEWFQCLSLHRARALLQCHVTESLRVTDAALACGFEHFGRFSEAYRELFGECPSERFALPPRSTEAMRVAREKLNLGFKDALIFRHHDEVGRVIFISAPLRAGARFRFPAAAAVPATIPSTSYLARQPSFPRAVSNCHGRETERSAVDLV